MSIHDSLLLNSNFVVHIGSAIYSFARIRNISEAIEVESVREGGDNQHVHSLLKQRSAEQKIVFERGLLANPDGEPDDEGLITKWEISGLDAMEGKTIYRTIEIIHSGLHEGKIP